MSRKAERLKSNHSRSQCSFQHLLSSRQTSHVFTARERNVQEESNVDVGYSLAKHVRKKHEMIVMNPDNVAGLVDIEYPFGKRLIHANVLRPRVLLRPTI